MTIIQALGAGIGTSARKARILLYLWAVNILFALTAAVPFLLLVQRELGHSLLGSRVGLLDPSWIGEAVKKYQASLPAMAGGLLAMGLLYGLLSVFLNGGIVGRLLDREGRSGLQAFFSDCGLYFGRFFRLFLLSLVVSVPVLGLLLELLSSAFRPLLENARTEWTSIVLSNLHFLVLLLVLSLVRMVLDYARIILVADEEKKVRRALRLTFGFLGKRFFRAWALYLVVALGSFAGTIVFMVLAQAMASPEIVFLGLGLLGMQTYILFRLWMTVLLTAAQAEYYRGQAD